MSFQEHIWLACFKNYELISLFRAIAIREAPALRYQGAGTAVTPAEVDKRSKIAATYTGIDRASTARLISSLSLGLGLELYGDYFCCCTIVPREFGIKATPTMHPGEQICI